MMTRFFGIAAVCLGVSSCLSSQTSSCASTQVEPTLAATGPRKVAVNQAAAFTISYLPASACGTFVGFLEQTSNANNDYVIGPRVSYSGCECPSTTVVAQATYSFTPTKAGTYYLHFLSNNSTGYITDTLVAQ